MAQKKKSVGGVTFFDTAQSNFPKIKLKYEEKFDAVTPRNNRLGSTLQNGIGGFFQDQAAGKNSSLDILDLAED